jgi:hypothetical protein
MLPGGVVVLFGADYTNSSFGAQFKRFQWPIGCALRMKAYTGVVFTSAQVDSLDQMPSAQITPSDRLAARASDYIDSTPVMLIGADRAVAVAALVGWMCIAEMITKVDAATLLECSTVLLEAIPFYPFAIARTPTGEIRITLGIPPASDGDTMGTMTTISPTSQFNDVCNTLAVALNARGALRTGTSLLAKFRVTGFYYLTDAEGDLVNRAHKSVLRCDMMAKRRAFTLREHERCTACGSSLTPTWRGVASASSCQSDIPIRVCRMCPYARVLRTWTRLFKMDTTSHRLIRIDAATFARLDTRNAVYKPPTFHTQHETHIRIAVRLMIGIHRARGNGHTTTPFAALCIELDTKLMALVISRLVDRVGSP